MSFARAARKHPLRLAVAIALLAFAAAVGGCGGEWDESPGEPEPAASSEPSAEEKQPGSAGAEGDREGADAEAGSEGDAESSANPSRDRSIQRFGEPADPEARKAMIAAVTSYFGALADNDPAAACGYLAPSVVDQIEELIAQGRKATDQEGAAAQVPGDCAAFLAHAGMVLSQSSAPDYGAIEFHAFRVEGDRGFAIYDVPKRPKSFIPTILEDDVWGLGAIDGSQLP